MMDHKRGEPGILEIPAHLFFGSSSTVVGETKFEF